MDSDGKSIVIANTVEGFMYSSFHEMKKVYTIWICMNHARIKDNAINTYRITENHICKSPRQDYDLLQEIMIYREKRG